MIIGLNLPNYGSLGYRDAIVAIAQTAEALGYASLWTNDHVLIPTSRPEPFGNVLESLTTLSYLAASTSRIQLGTGILVLPQRDPVLVAKQAATISHLSGGRLAMAVGVGYIKEEYCYLRADFSNRGHLADEYISAMRELFESDTPEFHGPHINYSDVLFSPRPSPRIPILVGGDSPAALKRAATLGDGWYGLWQSPDQVRTAIARINAIGRKSQFEVSLRVLTRVGGPIPDSDSETTLQGDVDAIVQKIQRYSDAGVDRIVIELVSSELDDFLRQLNRFAYEITPRITRTSD
ncbi:MAG: LLM class F420-dependent oxidoreductase [Chloroflexi bacterium]|nr:MAG: LLM class F420-dependent oxidoreductase [Chloroflexota bacterium]